MAWRRALLWERPCCSACNIFSPCPVPSEQAERMIHSSMIVMGVATILQTRLATIIQPAIRSAFGKRRLDLYNRTLGWLGGSLECIQHEGNAAFSIRLSALESM